MEVVGANDELIRMYNQRIVNTKSYRQDEYLIYECGFELLT